ncbi:hypothetical protein NDU88_004355 [Pleurodeles waltl]|uniref:Uncharacterized protein n=1 Tax=Pleurodeles waltl TaxID=8319 RepID=A0AAV7MUN5_PLEWA|nr:hypothetical protein NDU88_004355 [Pleurodeles waltl]
MSARTSDHQSKVARVQSSPSTSNLNTVEDQENRRVGQRETEMDPAETELRQAGPKSDYTLKKRQTVARHNWPGVVSRVVDHRFVGCRMCVAFQSGLNWISGGVGLRLGEEDRRGSNLGTQLSCSVTQFSSAACAVGAAPPAQAVSHLRAALSHGPDSNAARAVARPPLLLHRDLPAPRAPRPGAPASGAAFGAATQPRRRSTPGGSTPGSLMSLSLPGSDSSHGGAARPPIHPQLSQIIRMQRGALEARVHHA